MIKPYKAGTFDVADGHVLNYELFGTPKGIPILYLHGGPGAGFNDKHKRFFNPKLHNVIFYDQRGAGKSKPFASLHENNTQKLVQDTKELLDFLGCKKVILLGGSWGSTLSLTFAIEHKEYVLGMILWGIFLGTEDDINFCFQGGNSKSFPDVWERFVKLVPEKERGNIPAYYLKKMSSKTKDADTFAFEWAYYESSLLKLNTTEKQVLEDLEDLSYKALSPIEAHYMVNRCFLPDNFILDNAHKLSGVPTSIIHGRYDFLCPPINAYRLNKIIKGSRLFYVIAGHSARDKAIERKLISELQRISKLVERSKN